MGGFRQVPQASARAFQVQARAGDVCCKAGCWFAALWAGTAARNFYNLHPGINLSSRHNLIHLGDSLLLSVLVFLRRQIALQHFAIIVLRGSAHCDLALAVGVRQCPLEKKGREERRRPEEGRGGDKMYRPSPGRRGKITWLRCFPRNGGKRHQPLQGLKMNLFWTQRQRLPSQKCHGDKPMETSPSPVAKKD